MDIQKQIEDRFNTLYIFDPKKGGSYEMVTEEVITEMIVILEKITHCQKPIEGDSICGCKLDCHIHDWRQK